MTTVGLALIGAVVVLAVVFVQAQITRWVVLDALRDDHQAREPDPGTPEPEPNGAGGGYDTWAHAWESQYSRQ